MNDARLGLVIISISVGTFTEAVIGWLTLGVGLVIFAMLSNLDP